MSTRYRGYSRQVHSPLGEIKTLPFYLYTAHIYRAYSILRFFILQISTIQQRECGIYTDPGRAVAGLVLWPVLGYLVLQAFLVIYGPVLNPDTVTCSIFNWLQRLSPLR